MVRPSFRCRRPMPPPSVRPATPVCPTTPTGHTRPCACADLSSFERCAPPCAVARLRLGSTATAHAGEIDHHPAVAGREPRHAVGASAHRDHKVLVMRELDRADHVIDRSRPDDQRGMAIDVGVPDDPRLVVSRVAGLDDLARESAPQPRQFQGATSCQYLLRSRPAPRPAAPPGRGTGCTTRSSGRACGTGGWSLGRPHAHRRSQPRGPCASCGLP